MMPRHARAAANFRYTPCMTTLFIATRNAHKVGEIRAILGEQFQFLTLNEVPDPPNVVEDAGTFAGNAAKKAVELARWCSGSSLASHHSSLFVLADDSGLEVDALNGAPGVHSARFAAMDSGHPGNSSDADNIACSRSWRCRPEESRSPRRFVTPMNLIRRPSTAFAKGGSFPGRAEKKASATTRYSCRTDTSKHLPSWARQQKIN